MKIIIIAILICINQILPAQTNTLQPVYFDPDYQFVGVAVSKGGRVFVNYPNWTKYPINSVIEVFQDGSSKPYPNEKWNQWQDGENGLYKFVCIQSVYVDDENKLWVVDAASPGMNGVYEKSSKLVKIDLDSNAVERIYYFDKITGSISYLNDIRVDTKKGFAYLTNSAEGSLIVLNLKTGIGYEVLKNHTSTMSDEAYILKINGKPLTDGLGNSVRINSDGLALSPEGAWLYYKPLSDNHLYRISTYDLQNVSDAGGDLSDKVKLVADVSPSGGMLMDKEGFLYLSDVENSRIIRFNTQSNTSQVIVTDDRLSWPDSFALSETGDLYVTTSHIHLMPKYNNGTDMRRTPYKLFKINVNNF